MVIILITKLGFFFFVAFERMLNFIKTGNLSSQQGNFKSSLNLWMFAHLGHYDSSVYFQLF